MAPPRHHPGLEESAGCSSAVPDMAALLTSKMPVKKPVPCSRISRGVKLPRALLNRVAQHLRTQLDQQPTAEKRQWAR